MRNKGESGCRGLFTLGRVSSRLIITLMQGFIYVGIKLYWVMWGGGECFDILLVLCTRKAIYLENWRKMNISTIGAVWSEPFLLYRICRYWLMIIIQCIVKTFCYLNIQHLFLQTIVNFIKKRQVQKFSIRSKKITKLIHNIKVSIQVIYNLIKYCVFMILASIQIFIKIGP